MLRFYLISSSQTIICVQELSPNNRQISKTPASQVFFIDVLPDFGRFHMFCSKVFGCFHIFFEGFCVFVEFSSRFSFFFEGFIGCSRFTQSRFQPLSGGINLVLGHLRWLSVVLATFWCFPLCSRFFCWFFWGFLLCSLRVF